MTNYLMAFVVLVVAVHASANATQTAPARTSIPGNPVSAIIEAFRTHDIVTLTDPHGNVQVQAFLLSLIRDPRFRESVNDVVIETASARYQDAIDRFVRGDEVEMSGPAKSLGRPHRRRTAWASKLKN